MYANIVFGLVQLLVLIAMISWGILWMVTAYVAVYFAWLFTWHSFAHRYCGIRLVDLLKDILPYLGVTALALGVAWWASTLFESIYLRFGVKVIVAALVYLLIMWKSGSVAFRESLRFLLGRAGRTF